MDFPDRYSDLESPRRGPGNQWYPLYYQSLSIVLQKPGTDISNRPGKSHKKGDWEAELRAELEKKKGVQLKLNPKDQVLVNEQLAKESVIRFKVEEARQVVTTGLGIVQNLITIPSALGVESWYYQVLSIVLGGVVQKCGDFVGIEAVETYLVQACVSLY